MMMSESLDFIQEDSNLRGKGVVKDGYMDPKELARLILTLIELPRNMEVSEIVVNRNKVKLG